MFWLTMASTASVTSSAGLRDQRRRGDRATIVAPRCCMTCWIDRAACAGRSAGWTKLTLRWSCSRRAADLALGILLLGLEGLDARAASAASGWLPCGSALTAVCERRLPRSGAASASAWRALLELLHLRLELRRARPRTAVQVAADPVGVDDGDRRRPAAAAPGQRPGAARASAASAAPRRSLFIRMRFLR